MALRILIGAVAGGAAGLGWHKWIGCSGGACPLTANPYIATIYGSLMGALLAGNLR